MKREHRVSAADAMLTRKNQQQAWKRVKANKGAAGVDGLDIEQSAQVILFPAVEATETGWKARL